MAVLGMVIGGKKAIVAKSMLYFSFEVLCLVRVVLIIAFFVEEGFFACIANSVLRSTSCTPVGDDCNDCPSNCACACTPDCFSRQCCC